MKNLQFTPCILKITATISIVGLLVVISAVFGFASSGGEGGHHEAEFGKEMIYQLINFFLLVALLVYVYRKNAGGAFEKRSLEIKTAMEEAAAAKKKAEEKYQEYQNRLNLLDDEIRRIMERVKEDSEKEREKILAEANSQAEKLVKQAELTAKHEVELAKQMLRKEAVDLAAGLAAEAVKEAMTPEDQKNWVKTYIEKIGENP